MDNKLTRIEPKDGLRTYPKQYQKFWDRQRVYHYLGLDSRGEVILRVAVGYNSNGGAVASVRFSTPEVYGWGNGRATGYGYDKKSAAIEYALEDAGLLLAQGIAGCGDGAIRGALNAVLEHLSPEGFKLIETY